MRSRSIWLLGFFALCPLASAFAQVDENSITAALLNKSVYPSVEIGYSASTANPVMVNGRPAQFPVKTQIFPDGHEHYRIESGIVRADAARYFAFKSGLEFTITKVSFSKDHLEVELAAVGSKQQAYVQLMFEKGWQQSMNAGAVLSAVDAYLPSAETIAKRQAEDVANRAEQARQAQIASENAAKAAEVARAEAQAKAEALAAERRAESEKKLDQALLAKAKAGNAEAQYLVGKAYSDGAGGVAKDDVQATYWFRKAAEQGDAKGENALGVSYEFGSGVGKDYGQAIIWLHKAADQGNAKAEDNLGDLYYNGWGAPKDLPHALDLYRKAAAQGNSGAEFSIGYMFANGDTGKPDYAQAALWYRRSAEQGNDSAQNNLGVLYEHGRGVPVNRPLARSLYKKAYDQGNLQAKSNLEALERANTETTTSDDANNLFIDLNSYVRKVIAINNDAMPQCGFDGNRTLLSGLDTKLYLRNQYAAAEANGRRALIVALLNDKGDEISVRAGLESWKGRMYDRDGCLASFGSPTSSTTSQFIQAETEISEEANKLLSSARRIQLDFDEYVRKVLARGSTGRYEAAARALVGESPR